MTARGHTRAGLVALALSTAACSDDSREPLAPAPGPTASQTEQAEITGSMLGPDGTSFCNSVPAGSGFFVLVIDAANLFIPNAQEATCPAFTYSIAVDPGSYFLRVEVLTLDGIDALPWRTLSAGPISVEGSNVEQNIQIVEGTPSGDMSRWMESRYRM